MGVGTNRMNVYTVGMATQGLVELLEKGFPRRTRSAWPSAMTAATTAGSFRRTGGGSIFAANGFKVYLFDSLTADPGAELRDTSVSDCHSGVVVTASHNPKEYNGYKAYWSDGAQVVAPHDRNIIAEVAENHVARPSHDMERRPKRKHRNSGRDVRPNLSGSRSRTVAVARCRRTLPRHEDCLYAAARNRSDPGPRVATEIRFYEHPDRQGTEYPGRQFPDSRIPESGGTLGHENGNRAGRQSEKAEVVLATDPDADRIGMALRDENGQYVLLNGNQTCSLLVYYIVKRWSELGRLRGKEYIVKTIVTTELVARIAESFGVRHFDCLTGFKYIATVMRNHEQTMQYICGGEESFGFLAEDFVRDKDAVSACSLAAEAAAWAKSQDMTLYELLKEMYVRYGFFREALVSVVRKGKEGQEEIAKMMSDYRSDPPRSLGGSPIVVIKDYLNGEALDLANGSKTPIDMERSNVLQFTTADSTVVSIRPSGTEPKIKFYFGVRAELNDTARFGEVQAELDGKIESIKKEMGLV